MFVWMAILGGIMLLASLIALKFDWIFKGVAGWFKKDDPLEKFAKAIENQRASLTLAKQGVEYSKDWVRTVQREHDRSQADINRLTRRIETAIANKKDNEAKTLTERLILEEKEFETVKIRLSEAQSHCDQATNTLNQLEREIRNMEAKAKDLRIKKNLAEARREATAFMAEISTGIGTNNFDEITSKLNDQIVNANAQSSANERLIKLGKGNDEEYLSASKSVEDRLAEFKDNMKS